MKKANAKKEESIMIGDDWIVDVEGSLSFGIYSVFIDVFKDNFGNDEVKVIRELKELQKFL